MGVALSEISLLPLYSTTTTTWGCDERRSTHDILILSRVFVLLCGQELHTNNRCQIQRVWLNHIHSQTLPWSRFSPKILHLALACIRRQRRCNSLYHGVRIQIKDYRFDRSSSKAGSCHVHVHSIGYHIPLLISPSTVLHASM